MTLWYHVDIMVARELQGYTEVMAEKLVGLMLRLQPDLHTRLVERARAENRSLNNLIATWLRRCVEAGW
jgi:predicted HicB family RNase H-like nuclease